MRTTVAASALLALVFAGATAHAAEPAGEAAVNDALHLRTTKDLYTVCSVQPGQALYERAVSFCLGFVTGVIQYNAELAKGPEFKPLVCPGRELAPLRGGQAVPGLGAGQARAHGRVAGGGARPFGGRQVALPEEVLKPQAARSAGARGRGRSTVIDAVLAHASTPAANSFTIVSSALRRRFDVQRERCSRRAP